jgi:hypothetical protein
VVGGPSNFEKMMEQKKKAQEEEKAQKEAKTLASKQEALKAAENPEVAKPTEGEDFKKSLADLIGKGKKKEPVKAPEPEIKKKKVESLFTEEEVGEQRKGMESDAASMA